MPKGLEERRATLIETFAGFQAGFLSSEDFHRMPSIFMVFERVPSIFIFMHFDGFACISDSGCLNALRANLLPL